MDKKTFELIPEKERINRTLEGKAYFASVHSPNMSSVKKFKGEPFYIVNLGLTDEEAVKAASYGLKVNPPEANIPMQYVKIKRKVALSRGKTAEEVKPEVVDSMQNPVPPTILIGNESLVRCKFATYWYDTQGGGVGTALYKVQIRKLNRFVPSDRDLVMDDDGFSIDEIATETVDKETDDLSDELPWDNAEASESETTPTASKGKSKAKSSLFDE